MKQLALLLIYILSIFSATGQSDPEAIRILDGFSEKALQAPSVSMKFNLVTINQPENSTDTLQGNVIISGDKYRLELPDNIIFFNGVTSWGYLPAEKEVTVTKADKNDDSFMSRPSTIFSLYKEGYKCRLVEETSKLWVIDLYPGDIKSDVIRIRVVISKPQMDPVSFEYKRRDGITVLLDVLEYDLSQKPSAETFTFQESKHRDVEVIDMR